MPLARLTVELYGTQSALTQARDAIFAQYPAANKIYDRNDGAFVPLSNGLWELTVDCRLKTTLEGDKLRNQIAAAISTLQSFGVTGRAKYHYCKHLDADVEPCIPTEWII